MVDRLGVAAAVLAVAGLVAVCAGVSRVHGGQSELMGEFDLYRPAISDLDLLHPSPLDYHTFDYQRPDFATSMDMNLLSGSIGMPSYHFFKQQGRASAQSLATAGEGMNPSILEAASVLQQTAVDRRDVMDNEERAEAARCSGMLHACANWMALRTGKMRIITYGEGSWCTDDEVCWCFLCCVIYPRRFVNIGPALRSLRPRIDSPTPFPFSGLASLYTQVLGKACYQEGKDIAKDRLFDIPREGEPMQSELWATIQESW